MNLTNFFLSFSFLTAVVEEPPLVRTDMEVQTAPLIQPQPASTGAYSAFTTTSHKREMVRETEQLLPQMAVSFH